MVAKVGRASRREASNWNPRLGISLPEAVVIVVVVNFHLHRVGGIARAEGEQTPVEIAAGQGQVHKIQDGQLKRQNS